jgi:SAM-dependent methyltransferase
MKASTERFTGRADNYVRYRPSYSPMLSDFLRANCGLSSASAVADVGSGTGTLSRILLDQGCVVYGIEPNAEMRASAERLLAGCNRFRSIAATAEATTLPNGSIDLVTSGRSLHWVELAPSLDETRRILRPSGWAIALWNKRCPEIDPVAAGYDRILWTYCADYEALDARRTAAKRHLRSAGFEQASLAYRKTFDRSQLRGQILSLSVAPDEGDSRREPMLAAVDELFDRFQTNGVVTFNYLTTVYFGQPQFHGA